MKKFVKAIVVGSLPAFMAGVAAGESSPATAPATQAATQPATQPAAGKIVATNAPLVIPDGTSLQNPGPVSQPVWRNGGIIEIAGERR